MDMDNDGISDAEETRLAELFAPILYMHPDDVFYPITPQYALDHSTLMRADLEGGRVISENPTMAEISGLTVSSDNYYLDNDLGTIEDSGIETHFVANKASYPPVVHARVLPATYSGGSANIIQYWFYYPFNKGPMNTHEGDWEMITVEVRDGDEAITASYSQHLSGMIADWSLIEKDGNHPKAYVALGAHANYMRSYEGGMGLANDELSDAGTVLGPDDYTITMIGEPGAGNRPDSQGWLDFGGYWGEFGGAESGVLGLRGPLGPTFFQDGQRWSDPVGWSQTLTVGDSNYFQINWYIANFLMITLGMMAISLLVKMLFKLRLRKKQGTLGPRLLPFLYIDGFNAKSIGLILGIVALVVAIIGFFLPWYSVTLDINTGLFTTGGPVDVLTLDGVNGMQFNRLDSGGGMVQMVGLPIPFAWIFLAGVGMFLFGTIGYQKSRKVGTKLIFRGIKTMMPVLLIIIIISMLGDLISQVASDAPPEVASILGLLASNPVKGDLSGPLGGYGTVSMTWGLGIGAFMLIFSAILFFAAGAMEIIAFADYFKTPDDIARERAEEAAAASGFNPDGTPVNQTMPGYYPTAPRSIDYGDTPPTAQTPGYPAPGPLAVADPSITPTDPLDPTVPPMYPPTPPTAPPPAPPPYPAEDPDMTYSGSSDSPDSLAPPYPEEDHYMPPSDTPAPPPPLAPPADIQIGGEPLDEEPYDTPLPPPPPRPPVEDEED